MARAETFPATPAVEPVWLDIMETGARAWLSALTSLIRMSASVAEAQAAVGGEMVSFWMRGFPTGPAPVPNLLREELVLTGLQAERVADAAHKTLRDLDGPGEAAIPIPLPE
jgi:hypothetical protein